MKRSSSKVAACAIQTGPLSEDKEKNVKKCLELLRAANQKIHVDYALFPELSTTLFFAIGAREKRFFDLAESSQGPTIAKFERAASEYGTNIILPFFERRSVKGQSYRVNYPMVRKSVS